MFDREFWLMGVAIIGGTFLLTSLITAPLVVLANWDSAASCEARARMMNVPHVFGFWTGCMVRIKGEWVPLDSYRVLD